MVIKIPTFYIPRPSKMGIFWFEKKHLANLCGRLGKSGTWNKAGRRLGPERYSYMHVDLSDS
jgi:hypothetical protein